MPNVGGRLELKRIDIALSCFLSCGLQLLGVVVTALPAFSLRLAVQEVF
jgi:hypothetical protein